MRRHIHTGGSVRRLGVGDVIICCVITLLALGCLLPMLLVLNNSFATDAAIIKNGYSFFPRETTMAAYKRLFARGSATMRGYRITVFVTLVGTLSAVLITYMCGYSLANPHVRYRNGIALFFFATTVFNSGLVPWYMICRALHMYDNLWALIIPGMLFSPFNMFLMRNFIRGIPTSLMESAYIDGAGDGRIAFQIYFPLAVPVVATIALFYALDYWNNWFNAIMLLDNNALYPLQMILYKIQSDANMLKKLSYVSKTETAPTEAYKMAAAIVTIGPIILLYPFLQRYFTKGLIVGAIKG